MLNGVRRCIACVAFGIFYYWVVCRSSFHGPPENLSSTLFILSFFNNSGDERLLQFPLLPVAIQVLERVVFFPYKIVWKLCKSRIWTEKAVNKLYFSRSCKTKLVWNTNRPFHVQQAGDLILDDLFVKIRLLDFCKFLVFFAKFRNPFRKFQVFFTNSTFFRRNLKF